MLAASCRCLCARASVHPEELEAGVAEDKDNGAASPAVDGPNPISHADNGATPPAVDALNASSEGKQSSSAAPVRDFDCLVPVHPESNLPLLVTNTREDSAIVRTTDGEVILEMSLEETSQLSKLRVKETICKRLHIDSAQCKLYYEGRVLEEDTSFASPQHDFSFRPLEFAVSITRVHATVRQPSGKVILEIPADGNIFLLSLPFKHFVSMRTGYATDKFRLLHGVSELGPDTQLRSLISEEDIELPELHLELVLVLALAEPQLEDDKDSEPEGWCKLISNNKWLHIRDSEDLRRSRQ
eukprot:gb/GFBE01040595.1/.p1 GENE.gb/GFBE01040595.1/~~gb/GFBE01040595.1/.p1  ORF type:complete len:299 (+),score=53.59 gb/GFBE01040595.1/:1-897(+)